MTGFRYQIITCFPKTQIGNECRDKALICSIFIVLQGLFHLKKEVKIV